MSPAEPGTAAWVLQWLPHDVREALTRCPARDTWGHDYTETDRLEIRTMDGTVRVIVTESCECGARR